MIGDAINESSDTIEFESDSERTFTTFPQSFGKFNVERFLGGGGQGEVYLARDNLNRDIALKLLKPELRRSNAMQAAFLEEGRVAAQFDHPNLCKVHEFGSIDGIAYLALQYVDGGTLSDHLKDPEVVPDLQVACEIVRKLALAVAHIHDKDLLHRDLKPQNVRVTRTPDIQPVLIDFGLALRLNFRDSRLPAGGEIVGTLPYMSPEQINPGQTPVGTSSDIYSLGVILYKVVTGRVPFDGKDLTDLRDQICNQLPIWPKEHRGLPGLERICMMAMAKNPGQRFTSMRELAQALQDYINHPSDAPWTRKSQEIRPLLRRETIHFAFAEHGAVAPVNGEMRNRLYLDVGNALRPGVIDHHQLTGNTCATTSLIANRLDLIDASVAPEGADKFTIVLHHDPDLDCIASTYLAIEYLTTRTLPSNVDLLSNYVDRVDAGESCVSQQQPFTLYSATQRLLARPGLAADVARWKRTVEDGIKLTAFVLDTIKQTEASGKDGLVKIDDVDAFAAPGLFDDADRAAVREDLDRYDAKLGDQQRTHPRMARLKLPSQFGDTEVRDALFVRDVQNDDDPARVAYFKNWARSDVDRSPSRRGFEALSVFHTESANDRRRCIISVTPQSYASLRGLGTQLDEAESAKRIAEKGVDDRVVDPITDAKIPPRPGYPNADPWYDGRAHSFTIVDSPRGGTRLTVDEIEQIFLDYGAGVAEPLPWF